MKNMLHLLPILVLVAPLAAGDFVLLEGDSLDLDVGGFRGVSFALQEHQADSAAIEGVLTILPDTASVELLLMHQDDFARWTAGLAPVDTLAAARVTGGPLRLEIPRFGMLILVVSNRGNHVSVRVECRLDVVFHGPESPRDPLSVGLKLLLVLMTAAVVIAVAAGVIVRETSVRRRRRS